MPHSLWLQSAVYEEMEMYCVGAHAKSKESEWQKNLWYAEWKKHALRILYLFSLWLFETVLNQWLNDCSGHMHLSVFVSAKWYEVF